MLNSLQRDVKLIVFSRGIRAFAFSYLNIVFAIYLNRIGYSTVAIGIIHSVAYISGALLTAVWGYTSDRIGRKNVLTILAILTIISNTILILSTNLAFILLAVVIINVGAGGSAGGVTNLARVVPFGVSPTLSAYMMQSLSLNMPFVIGGSFQLAHDFIFYYLFRHVRPPEEERSRESGRAKA